MPAPEIESVAWFSPETHGEEYPNGAYVEVLEDGSFGGPVVCVNDSPADPVDGSSHFERFSGKKADYFPRMRLEGVIQIGDGGVREFVPGSDTLVRDSGIGAIPVQEA
jgi:hypothetical protein